jgi:putative hydrolases of HD superfamily
MKNNTKKLAAFFYEAGQLRRIPRAHAQTLLTTDPTDTIASHSYRVSVIGWHLAKLEKADANKVLLMCLFHDFGEIRSGDQNWIHKRYVKVFEDEIANDQFNDHPFKDDLFPIVNEYRERKTKESIIAKDADLLDQILILREYEWAGYKEASVWLGGKGRSKRNEQYELLKTKSAKKLADEIMTQNPSDWWKNVWTEKRR